MTIYDSLDMDWGWDGDYLLSEDGDLKDTSDNFLKSVVTEIQTIIKSEVGDWRHDVQVGADLSEYIGEPNTRQTAELIKQRLEGKLSQIVNSKDLSIRIVPVELSKSLVLISLKVSPTIQNGLQAATEIRVHHIYDYIENGVFSGINSLQYRG